MLSRPLSTPHQPLPDFSASETMVKMSICQGGMWSTEWVGMSWTFKSTQFWPLFDTFKCPHKWSFHNVHHPFWSLVQKSKLLYSPKLKKSKEVPRKIPNKYRTVRNVCVGVGFLVHFWKIWTLSWVLKKRKSLSKTHRNCKWRPIIKCTDIFFIFCWEIIYEDLLFAIQ